MRKVARKKAVKKKPVKKAAIILKNPVVKKLVEKKENQITKTKKKLKTHQAQLEKLSQEISTYNFISNHDLQEPLRKLQLISSLVLDTESTNLSSDGKAYIKMMAKSANKMRDLIQDLQEYSNTASTKEKIERINLNDILSEVKLQLKDLIKEKQAGIYNRRLCKTSGIRYQLKKLFRDILINSLRYAKDGIPPKIMVKSRVRTGKELKQKNAIPAKRYCHISFIDNGQGFDPKYNEQIFGIFKKLHKNEHGTGIGLAICKKIVENHGGFIKANGSPGKGAVIDVYIPY